MKLLGKHSENKAELLASWKFVAGDVNFRAMHLFKYPEVSIMALVENRLIIIDREDKFQFCNFNYTDLVQNNSF